MTHYFALDSAPENMAVALALETDDEVGNWNGFPAPLATAAAVADFMRRWAANDPNGVWPTPVVEADALTLTFEDRDADRLPAGGVDATGATLYNMGGWDWTEVYA